MYGGLGLGFWVRIMVRVRPSVNYFKDSFSIGHNFFMDFFYLGAIQVLRNVVGVGGCLLSQKKAL